MATNNSKSRVRASAYAGSVAACLLTAAVATPLHPYLDLANMVMLFLLTVFLVARWLGRGPAILAAFLSVALFDVFFVPPRFSFAVSDVQYLVTFAVMLTVGLITAQLTTGLRHQADVARERQAQAQSLYELARDLAGVVESGQLRTALERYLEQGLGYRPAHHLLDAAGKLLPLDSNALQPGHDRQLLDTVASLAALTAERLHYVEVAQSSRIEVTSERLRSSVLSALSHDLRTPLTALVGMADSLAVSKDAMSDNDRATAAAIRDQARAMSRLLGNLLDMARLRAGKVELRREWQLFEDVISAGLHLLRPTLGERPIHVDLPPNLPLVEFDAVLLERVVCNLLENAAKYSPAGTPIEIRAFVDGDRAGIAVCDHGQGFPPGQVERVFGMFERGQAESSTPGVGLGLAICRAIIEAHGGAISAGNRPEGGACVTLRLPLGTPPAIEEEPNENEEPS